MDVKERVLFAYARELEVGFDWLAHDASLGKE
jgi:hypothetical protein